VIRVTLPYHLRSLAGVDKEVSLDVDGIERHGGGFGAAQDNSRQDRHDDTYAYHGVSARCPSSPATEPWRGEHFRR
jgi:hypothetical protein